MLMHEFKNWRFLNPRARFVVRLVDSGGEVHVRRTVVTLRLIYKALYVTN